MVRRQHPAQYSTAETTANRDDERSLKPSNQTFHNWPPRASALPSDSPLHVARGGALCGRKALRSTRFPAVVMAAVEKRALSGATRNGRRAFDLPESPSRKGCSAVARVVKDLGQLSSPSSRQTVHRHIRRGIGEQRAGLRLDRLQQQKGSEQYRAYRPVVHRSQSKHALVKSRHSDWNRSKACRLRFRSRGRPFAVPSCQQPCY